MAKTNKEKEAKTTRGNKGPGQPTQPPKVGDKLRQKETKAYGSGHNHQNEGCIENPKSKLFGEKLEFSTVLPKILDHIIHL